MSENMTETLGFAVPCVSAERLFLRRLCAARSDVILALHLFVPQLRREKIDLENTLEQEQEALVNRLWKRMDKLEAEKRLVMIQWCCIMIFLRGSCRLLNVLND